MRPERNTDANKRRFPLVVQLGLAALIGLIPGQPGLHSLQQRQSAITFTFRCLNALHRTVERRSHHAGQRHGQTRASLLKLLLLFARVIARIEGDIIALQEDVFPGHHIGAADRDIVPSLHRHRIGRAAKGADALTLCRSLIAQFLAGRG